MITQNTYNAMREENRATADETFIQLNEMVREGLGCEERSHVLSVDDMEGKWFNRGMYIIFAGAIPAIIRPDEGLEGYGWTIDFLSNVIHYSAHNIDSIERAMREAAQVYANAMHPMPSRYAVVPN